MVYPIINNKQYGVWYDSPYRDINPQMEHLGLGKPPLTEYDGMQWRKKMIG